MCVDGWIPVDPYTLATSFPDVYAVGDVTSVGTPKAGVFAEGQAAVVADAIIARHRGGRRRDLRRPRGLLHRVRWGQGRGGRRHVPPRAAAGRCPRRTLRRHHRRQGASSAPPGSGGGSPATGPTTDPVLIRGVKGHRRLRRPPRGGVLAAAAPTSEIEVGASRVVGAALRGAKRCEFVHRTTCWKPRCLKSPVKTWSVRSSPIRRLIARATRPRSGRWTRPRWVAWPAAACRGSSAVASSISWRRRCSACWRHRIAWSRSTGTGWSRSWPARRPCCTSPGCCSGS